MARLSRTGGKTDNVKTRKPKPRKASPAEGRTTAKTKAIRASSVKAKGAKAKTAKTNPAKARTAKTKIADTKRRVAPAATPRALAHISDLLTELKEIREQQAATAEILKVINASPGDLTPVFEVILEKTHHLCDVASGSLQLFEDGQVQTVATRGFNERWKQYLRQGYEIDDTNREALETTLPRHVADMREVLDRSANATSRAFVEIGGFRTLLGLPLLKDGKAIGRIVATREEVRPFTDRQIALLQGFADQAVIAIENARLFNEVQARTRELSESLQQQTATADVLKVISRSTFDLQTVLETLIKSAVDLSGANRGSIFLREGGVFPLKAASHTTPEFLQYWAANPPRAGRGSATHRVIASGKVEIIPDVLEDPEMQMPPGALARIRATLGVPMLRDNKVEGVLVLTRPEPGHFSKSQIDLVQTFADQAVIAVENVRLFDETQARSRELAASLEELRTAQDRLVQTEKLASLGQLTAGIAHEIKNPLNFVNNFSSLSSELIDELDEALAPAALDQKTRDEVGELTAMLKANLEKVVQHGKRADSIVKNMLLHSREGSGEHRAADINALVEESLNLAYHGARAEKPAFNITLTRDLDPEAGAAELYPQEITRALLNFITNGFYAATRRKAADDNFEPALRATTKNLGKSVEIRIRDNGTGIPPDVREKMFNPFFTTKPAGEGTGLGLSMSHDIIVKQHGGRIDVETEPGAFTEFIITLPRQPATPA
jgi:two-component system NtrC family sensor kinase